MEKADNFTLFLPLGFSIMKKVLVINNRDSFVFNLVQLLRENSHCSFEMCNVEDFNFTTLNRYTHILLSPGPGLPTDFPNMMRIIEQCKFTHSILGICLGMQAISLSFGASMYMLEHPKHGHSSILHSLLQDHPIFNSLPPQIQIGRYHSWVVERSSLSPSLIALAEDEDANLMAIKHVTLPIYGLQFHPESYLSNCGAQIIDNWLR